MKIFLSIKPCLIGIAMLMGSVWCAQPLFAQTKDTVERKQAHGTSGMDDSVDPAGTVEIMPEPPGGMQAFMQWVGQTYQYPTKAIDAAVRGTVKISFVVEKNGALSNFKILQDLGYGTGQEAVRVLKRAPKWSPGIQKGKPVRVMYALPIMLNLTE